MQQHAGHLLHLLFHSLAVTGNSLLYLHGGVLVDGQACLRCRQQDHAAGFCHADDRGLIVLVEQLFDGKHLGPSALDHLFDACIHLVQTALERHARVGAHRTEVHRRKPVACVIHHAPAHDGVAGVDAQNSHATNTFRYYSYYNFIIISQQNSVSNRKPFACRRQMCADA